jgi:glycerol-3-phosphate acyltransferase PlsY
MPTAYIAGRRLKGRDIREMGDGNVSAQNARTRQKALRPA